jgi:hypothetical protein
MQYQWKVAHGGSGGGGSGGGSGGGRSGGGHSDCSIGGGADCARTSANKQQQLLLMRSGGSAGIATTGAAVTSAAAARMYMRSYWCSAAIFAVSNALSCNVYRLDDKESRAAPPFDHKWRRRRIDSPWRPQRQR